MPVRRQILQRPLRVVALIGDQRFLVRDDAEPTAGTFSIGRTEVVPEIVNKKIEIGDQVMRVNQRRPKNANY